MMNVTISLRELADYYIARHQEDVDASPFICDNLYNLLFQKFQGENWNITYETRDSVSYQFYRQWMVNFNSGVELQDFITFKRIFQTLHKWNARGEMFYKLNNYYDGDTSSGRAENYRIKCLELALEKYPNLILGFEIPTRSDIDSFQS